MNLGRLVSSGEEYDALTLVFERIGATCTNETRLETGRCQTTRSRSLRLLTGSWISKEDIWSVCDRHRSRTLRSLVLHNSMYSPFGTKAESLPKESKNAAHIQHRVPCY